MGRTRFRSTVIAGSSAAIAVLLPAPGAYAHSAAAATTGYRYARVVVQRGGRPCSNLKVNAVNNKGVYAGTVYCAPRSQGFIVGHRATFAFPGGPMSDTLVSGLSDTGTVVGDSEINYSGPGTAWLRTPAGKYRKINYPHAGYWGTWPQAVNKNNVIVGQYYRGTATHYSIRGYTDHGGHFSNLTLPRSVHATDSGITGIDNRGDICGWYNAATGPVHGFVIIGGRFHTVDAPGAGHARGQGTQVNAITDNGTYAGIIQFAPLPDNNHQYRPYKRGFVFRNGRFTSITVPSTWGNNTDLDGMNDAGTLVGYFVHRVGNGWNAEGFRAVPK